MGYSVTCPYVWISVFHLSGDCDYIKRFTAPLVASVQCQTNTEDRNWTASKIYTFILTLSPSWPKIEVLGVLPAHLPLIMDAGILVSVPPLSCAGFVCCHCTERWAVTDNTHGKDSGAFR